MSLNSLLSSPEPPHSGARTSSKRSLAWLLPVGLLVGFILVFGLLFGEKFLPSVTVRTERVQIIRDSSNPTEGVTGQLLFQASGWLEPSPYAIHVPALVNGVVAEVFVLEGETVTEGQILANLVDDEAKLALERAERKLTTIRSQVVAHCSQVPEFKAQLSSAKAKVKAEQARLAELTDQAQRLRSLPGGAVSVGEIAAANLQEERQRAIVLQAESEVPRIESQLTTIDYERLAMGNTFSEAETDRDLAKLALERHTIRSPVEGRILHLHAFPGVKRMLNMDEPKSALIVELYQPTSMQARIDVPLNEAAGLAVGQPVELSTELLPNLTLTGEVDRITGEADMQRNTLQVKIEIANPDDRLRPEMLVRARFFPAPIKRSDHSPTEESRERLVLFAPEAAFFQIDNDTAKAWVVSETSTANLRNLKLGATRKDRFREVREGLRAGEQVILPPFTHLSEGTRLRVQSNQL